MATHNSVVVRTDAYPDAELKARDLGHIDVVVRSVENPIESLEGATVTIQQVFTDSTRKAYADQRGVGWRTSTALRLVNTVSRQ